MNSPIEMLIRICRRYRGGVHELDLIESRRLDSVGSDNTGQWEPDMSRTRRIDALCGNGYLEPQQMYTGGRRQVVHYMGYPSTSIVTTP